MEQSRRNSLRHVQKQPTTHAGLWFDKYLLQQVGREEELPSEERNPLLALVEEVALSRSDGYKPTDTYAQFFRRWEDALNQYGAVTRRATVQGRLSIGLGAEGVLETAITLHRTYGIPYIPGSALKGLAASYARNRLQPEIWSPGKGAYETLFGDTDSAGYVIFFDALYVPGSGYRRQGLYSDVITVHHPDYYQRSDVPPADWDNPTPIPFLSATGDYLLALAGDYKWVETTYVILDMALREVGVGAKTSSGYGRMKISGLKAAGKPPMAGPEKTTSRQPDPERGIVDSFLMQLKGMPNAKVAGEIRSVYEQWKKLNISGGHRREIAQAILDKIEAAGRTKKSAGQDWYQELQAALICED